MNTYSLYLKIRELKVAEKNPDISHENSWEIRQLRLKLEAYYEFLVQLNQTMKEVTRKK